MKTTTKINSLTTKALDIRQHRIVHQSLFRMNTVISAVRIFEILNRIQ